MALILDSDVCVEIIRGNTIYKSKLEENIHSGLKITFMTVSELLYGAYLSKLGESQLIATISFLDIFEFLAPNLDACHVFGKIKSELQKEGKLIPDADLIIGSIAIASEIPLLTNNLKHFQRLTDFGLRLEKW